MKLEPAKSIITRLGGAKQVADTTGAHITRVYKWAQPRDVGGTGGLIPQRYHLVLLDLAARKDVPLTAGDFLPVREREIAG
jgi:hypothetical protein